MKRFFGMVGMAMRAGKIVVGCDVICTALAKGGIKLVLIASDASDATKKRLSNKTKFYNVPAIEAPVEADRLGALIGKTYAPAAIAVSDAGFAEEIKRASENMRKEVFALSENR